MTEFWNSIVTILLAVIGIAALAIIVSKQANTTGVLSTGASAFSQILGTAESPVTGANAGALGFNGAQSFPQFSI